MTKPKKSRKADKPNSQKADKVEVIKTEEVLTIKTDKGKHPGSENLIPMSERSKEEVREIAAKGGRNSGVTRRKNKTFKEALQWYLDMEVQPKNKTEKALLEQFPGLTNRDYVAIAAIEASQEKDVRAMVFARDTTGEIPKQTIGIEQEKPFEINIKTID